MKTLLLALSIGLIGFIMVANDAEARRFGGGRSIGRSAPIFQKKPSQTQSAAQRQSQTRPANQNTGSRRWLGPLAGLVAGGLIGALLFGDLFEGFQFMDFLLILALIFGGIWLFRNLRRGASPPHSMQRQAHATAGGGSQPDSFTTPEIGSGLSNNQQADFQIPSWFNEESFLQAAKSHFVRLQAAWDVGDMKDIREYTTPQLFGDLTLERQSYKGEQQFTEVVELDAELVGLAQEDNLLIASVRYNGIIREEQDGDTKSFTEIWHIQRALDEDNANWYVAGIQQENL